MVDAENTIYLTPAEVLQIEAAAEPKRLSWLDRDPLPHEYDGDPF